MKVIVNMACGLANRMFQYSYYLYLKKLGYDVYVDYYKTAKLQHEQVAWDRIFPNAPMLQASSSDVLRTGGGSGLVARLRRRFLPSSCQVQTLSAFEAPLPPKDGPTVYMMGVFQNAKMAEQVQPEALKAFEFKPFTDEANLGLMHEMQASESVAIHVRKGADYTSRIFYQDTCPADYYRQAVAYLRDKCDNPRFYVFADNKEWVKENFTDFDYVLVGNNPVVGYGSHFDMQLMSLCKHNIISNSTYSWWSAFLNKNSEKLVVLPRVWFNPKSCDDFTSQNVKCQGWCAL